MPELFVLSGADVGRSWDVGDGATFGRAPESTVRLRDRSISRRHAHLEQTDDGWVVVDDGSRNGLFADGARTGRVALADGREFRLGEVELRFREAAAPAPSAERSAGGDPPPAAAPPDAPSDAPPDAPPAPVAVSPELDLGDEIELDEEPEIVVGGGAAPSPRPPAPAGTPPADAPRPRRASRAAERAADVVRPAPGAASTLGDDPRVRGRGGTGRLLQYHRVEHRRGFLSADLSQYPAWVRVLVYLTLVGVAGGLGWLAFFGVGALSG